MTWAVLLHPEFAPEFQALAVTVQIELSAYISHLQKAGPNLKRPHADTLNGSRHANMKELRFSVAGGVWRVAFAFDPKRQAIVLVAGDKSGVGRERFYKKLLATADRRFDQHLAYMENKK